MRFLRTVSTRRLLAIIAGFVSAIAAGTAIAVAAAGHRPGARCRSRWRTAVHDALAAPKVSGITARISFTNHLIDATDIQGADPILSAAPPGGCGSRATIGCGSSCSPTTAMPRSSSTTARSGSMTRRSNTAYEGTLPANGGSKARDEDRRQHDQLPSIAQIQTDIGKLAQPVRTCRGAIPSDVAGQAAYTVRVSPKHDGGLLGAGELAWDAVKGVPLRFAVLRAQRQLAGARAEGDRHLLRRASRRRCSRSRRRAARRSSRSTRQRRSRSKSRARRGHAPQGGQAPPGHHAARRPSPSACRSPCSRRPSSSACRGAR